MLTISEARYQAIRQAVHQRRTETLAAKIDTASDFQQARFSDVDDFMNFLDTQVEQHEAVERRSPKRP